MAIVAIAVHVAVAVGVAVGRLLVGVRLERHLRAPLVEGRDGGLLRVGRVRRVRGADEGAKEGLRRRGVDALEGPNLHVVTSDQTVEKSGPCDACT